MRFDEKLKQLIDLRGVRQKDLAKRVGVWPSRITTLSAPPAQKKNALGEVVEEIKIEPSKLVRLADALDVPIRFLADPNITDPSQVEVAEGGLSETEKLILANARILGHQEALARILGKPPGSPATQGSLPFEESQSPGPGKRLVARPVPKKSEEKPAEKPAGSVAKRRR